MPDRCTQALSCTYTAGGHGHLEQPSGAMSWREPSTKQWLRQANCVLVTLAACAFGWDITKKWFFASSFRPLSNIATACPHPAGSHQSIAGAKDEHGIYFSSLSTKIGTGLCPTNFSFDNIFLSFPKKGWQQDPRSFVDGGGLGSIPDWSKPPINAEKHVCFSSQSLDHKNS